MRRFTGLLIAVAMVCMVGISTCGTVDAKVEAATPGSTLCKAELDSDAVARFQGLITNFGHNLKVLEGTAFATAAQVKSKTFTVFLKCVDEGGMVYIVTVCFVKDNLAAIKVKPTGERSLQS